MLYNTSEQVTSFPILLPFFPVFMNSRRLRTPRRGVANKSITRFPAFIPFFFCSDVRVPRTSDQDLWVHIDALLFSRQKLEKKTTTRIDSPRIKPTSRSRDVVHFLALEKGEKKRQHSMQNKGLLCIQKVGKIARPSNAVYRICSLFCVSFDE